MKKTKNYNNVQNYDLFNNSSTKKKEDRNNSMISLQENNTLLYNTDKSFINMPSGISNKGQQIFPNYPITPLKRRNILISSSNKYKNFSSSGLIWNKSKNFNSNINNDNNTKRKLFVSNMNTNINQEQNQNINFALNSFLNNENNINNNITFFTPSKNRKEKEDKTEKEKEKEKEKEEEKNRNSNKATKIFFTDYGLGYKCNCTKTGCNKFYCQCFNQGRYCHGCNCQNCQNKKPDYISSNRRPKETEEKLRETIISCTCTKSGCNKNYCECYKNKMKCNSLCRCINCENIDSEKTVLIDNDINNKKYQCCSANSVFIVNNEIIVEDILKKKENRKIKIMINDILSESSSDESENIGKKRKRTDNEIHFLSNKKSKISEENTNESIKGKKNELSHSDLFDKEGKLILTHIKL